MVGLDDVFMSVQILLLVAITFGSYYGRKLNMRLHHRLIYGTVVIQTFVFFFWMRPSVSFWQDEIGTTTTILGLHIVTGLISGISCLILCGVFLIRKNEYDLPLLRWTKPFMIFTFIMWVISFIFGTIFYIQAHVLGLYN